MMDDDRYVKFLKVAIYFSLSLNFYRAKPSFLRKGVYPSSKILGIIAVLILFFIDIKIISK